ncbi:MAG: hydroxymethylbilane synthase [Verrucomicrobia bacterium]|nr:hydroxymethylbilane synthase [Verrucomicrobiota bacterium]
MRPSMNSCDKIEITVGSRDSPLSQKQVEEVFSELSHFHPFVTFVPFLMKTTGDLDLKSSLRHMENSNFFTKEIDEMQLKGQFRISIHSAKDLPDPIADGLSMVALTRGQDPSDSLVLAEGVNLQNIRKGASLATSSLRREKVILSLIPDAQIVDIRGTIGNRLEKLQKGEVDGLVVAEAALIRLGLTSLNRIKLEGPVAAYQGQLAVLARSDDKEMFELFSCIDSRRQ